MIRDQANAAIERVLMEAKGWISNSLAYERFYDVLRSSGIRAAIPTRRQFSMLTGKNENIIKKRLPNASRGYIDEVHLKWETLKND